MGFDTTKLGYYAKAVAAFLTGVLTVLAVVISVSEDGITAQEWGAVVSAIVGAIAGTGAVSQTKNKER